jgi:hypothetical protein
LQPDDPVPIIRTAKGFDTACVYGLGSIVATHLIRLRRTALPLPPPLTEEQRRQALQKAAIARRKRAELKQQLKSKSTTLKDLLARTDDEIVGKMKVSTVLESLPGVGRVRARKLMARLDISESRRMRGLGEKQKKNLLAEIADH